MALVADFRSALQQLPRDWAEARLVVHFDDERRAREAAAYLTSLAPGRYGDTLRFSISRGAGSSPDLAARALRRVDAARLGGTLELVGASEAAPALPLKRPKLVEAWDREVATLPPDWSDVYAEIDFTSTDYLERAALLMAPTNPARFDDRPGFRFRCARRFGYGAAQMMVRRCLERLDEEDIRGEVTILHALSDTSPWSTQGPVWHVGGRNV
ncbi:MAG TPA: hypothetical protein VFP31_04620 [Gaiellaceae bacterium]|nr:hypothetical protein [Gaiellaceae bacterium]